MYNQSQRMFSPRLEAVANMEGSSEYPKIAGSIRFYSWRKGTIIRIELEGLPNENKNNYFAFHIHSGDSCRPKDGADAFSEADGHFNPENDSHPNHVGDILNIYSNDGYCYMEIFTKRFLPKDVIGKTCIIHSRADDLFSQPAGNSGERIACGVIKKI